MNIVFLRAVASFLAPVALRLAKKLKSKIYLIKSVSLANFARQSRPLWHVFNMRKYFLNSVLSSALSYSIVARKHEWNMQTHVFSVFFPWIILILMCVSRLSVDFLIYFWRRANSNFPRPERVPPLACAPQRPLNYGPQRLPSPHGWVSINAIFACKPHQQLQKQSLTFFPHSNRQPTQIGQHSPGLPFICSQRDLLAG